MVSLCQKCVANQLIKFVWLVWFDSIADLTFSRLVLTPLSSSLTSWTTRSSLETSSASLSVVSLTFSTLLWIIAISWSCLLMHLSNSTLSTYLLFYSSARTIFLTFKSSWTSSSALGVLHISCSFLMMPSPIIMFISHLFISMVFAASMGHSSRSARWSVFVLPARTQLKHFRIP